MKRVLTTIAFTLPLLAQAAQPTPTAADEPALQMTNLWQSVMAGGWVMVPLGFLSIITIMLILAFLFSLRRGTMVSARYMQTADALIRKKDFLGLLAISNRHNEAVARVMARTMDFITKNPKATLVEAREIAQAEGVRQASDLTQRVAYLADIGTLAPMLGLLGTVVGIVHSFQIIAQEAAKPTILAQGISQALIATAAGLLIGIPAMGAYAYFRGRAQSLISDLEAASTQLLALLGTTSGKNLS